MPNPNITVIGSGLAAQLLIKSIRQHNPDCSISMITQDQGDFYSKPLLSTALTKGTPPADLPTATGEAVAAQYDVHLMPSTTVTAIDRTARTLRLLTPEGIQTHTYDTLVLACGATPKPAPIESKRLFSINDLTAYQAFRAALKPGQHVSILGAGLVACEFANDLLNTGYAVDLIAPDDRLLPKVVDPQTSTVLHAALSTLGLKTHLSHTVTHVDDQGQQTELTLSNGKKHTTDLILSAVGIEANIALAQSAQLKTNQGIIVNTQLQTSDPHIYALGDCAEFEGRCRFYIAPILTASKVLAAHLTGQAASLTYPIMPVIVKTPALPIVAVPPTEGTIGSWEYQEAPEGRTALFKNTAGDIAGFVLTQQKIRERSQWIQAMSTSA
jgi:rubredoxin-NAD+ reductase